MPCSLQGHWSPSVPYVPSPAQLITVGLSTSLSHGLSLVLLTLLLHFNLALALLRIATRLFTKYDSPATSAVVGLEAGL